MAFAAETICVQGSNERRDPFGAISMPIYQNAAYAHPGLGQSTGYDYSRCGNPTRDEVQKTVALLEQGTEALAFSTGMAAITALMEIFSPGDHLIATDDLYGGTLRLWNTISHKNGISVDCVDTSNVETVKAAIRPETKAIYLETPSNPMMKVADIQAIAELAHAHECLLIVDNTFLSPYFQKPLTLGADVVVHSGTKYLEGHNDTLSGFLVVRDDALYQQLNNIYKTQEPVCLRLIVGYCFEGSRLWLYVWNSIRKMLLRSHTGWNRDRKWRRYIISVWIRDRIRR